MNSKRSGVNRWWADAKSVYEETQFLHGPRHGLARRWKTGNLERAYSKGMKATKGTLTSDPAWSDL